MNSQCALNALLCLGHIISCLRMNRDANAVMIRNDSAINVIATMPVTQSKKSRAIEIRLNP
jgi:hypothetical protein